jgi:hypothetical protein
MRAWAGKAAADPAIAGIRHCHTCRLALPRRSSEAINATCH